MFNVRKPSFEELPTSQELLRSTKIAAYSALAILLIVVLPAEYAVDLTGIGGLLGLKKMGEIKQSLQMEAEDQDRKVLSPTVAEPTESKNTVSKALKKESVSAIIEPNGTAEIKAKMSKGDSISYSWKTDGGTLNYDAHGEASGFSRGFAQYAKGTDKSSFEEKITAEFDGTHGLFWRNRWDRSVTVTLEAEGTFERLYKAD